jgi:PAS domain S-box-containing protein
MSPIPIKLLLIDDNPADRMVYRRYLLNISDSAYSLWEEETGQKGIRTARSVQPDCVVVDYHLPDSDGLEVVRQLRSQVETVDTPIIILTGSTRDDIAVAAIRHGVSDYLHKDNLTRDGLHQAIQQAIEKASLHKIIKIQNQTLEEKNRALENALVEVRAAHDQLEHRVAERTSALQKANDALQLRAQVLATMHEGLLVLTKDWHIVLTNTALDMMFGYEQGELTGCHISILSPGNGDQKTFVTDEVVHALTVHKVWRGRVTNCRKDGPLFVSAVRINSVQIGGQDYFVSLQEDITEREALEAKVHEQERMANVGTTAVRLTHEIGNRLNGLSTSVQLLERELRKAPKINVAILQETVTDLKGETERMSEFLQDLRTLARAYRLNITPFDAVPLIQEVLQIYAPRCQHSGITVIQSLPSSLTPVFADSDRCNEVLHHLLNNAVEAMPRGGTLTIDSVQTPQWVRITIRDTGPGIPEGIDIFAPFISTKPGGTGLGLTIALQLVVAQRGTLTFTSSASQGTTFILELPSTTDGSHHALTPQESSPISPIHSRTIHTGNQSTPTEQLRSASTSHQKRLVC